jgi:hypothetical protein
MSKDGLNKNHWIIIFLVGAVALWAAIEYLFWGTKPTPLGEALTAILVMYIGFVDALMNKTSALRRWSLESTNLRAGRDQAGD